MGCPFQIEGWTLLLHIRSHHLLFHYDLCTQHLANIILAGRLSSLCIGADQHSQKSGPRVALHLWGSSIGIRASRENPQSNMGTYRSLLNLRYTPLKYLMQMQISTHVTLLRLVHLLRQCVGQNQLLPSLHIPTSERKSLSIPAYS